MSEFHVTARHRNVWGLRITCLLISTKICLRLLYSWISKKHLTLQGTLACYILYKLQFSSSLIKLISSFLSQRKLRVPVEGEMSTPREMHAGMPQDSVLSPTWNRMYIWPSLPRIAKGVIFSDRCSAVCCHHRLAVSESPASDDKSLWTR
jgi:hypothetical protein